VLKHHLCSPSVTFWVHSEMLWEAAISPVTKKACVAWHLTKNIFFSEGLWNPVDGGHIEKLFCCTHSF
jgi:hypothetical protein